ncbi:MAG: response regulator [Bacteriovoracaceae bacterium]|nr:response regulator [Bacteriovoracaceae bacterium]
MSVKEAVKNINVIVIDDEEKICELLRVFLGTMGPFNSIVIANNTLQAMQKFQNQKFDLLILDQVLPGKLGLEFAESLRKSVKFHNLKILLISGFLQQDDVIRSVDLGIKHILVKPFTRQQLISKVSEILKLEEDLEH